MTEKEITSLIRKHSAKPLFGVVIVMIISIFLNDYYATSRFALVTVFILSVGSCMYIIRKVLVDVLATVD